VLLLLLLAVLRVGAGQRGEQGRYAALAVVLAIVDRLRARRTLLFGVLQSCLRRL
jgi:hypothetical protein